MAVAGRLNGILGPDVTIHLTGGDLRVEWEGFDANGVARSVFMTGPAVEVFSGVWPGGQG